MPHILSRKFYARLALAVAPELLGKYLVRENRSGEKIAALITEVEAYTGIDDLASHASKGRTARTEVMFGPGGFWYVYLIYGMHYLLNIVVGEKDNPEAILIRSVEGVSGPGRVAKFFGVDKSFYGRSADKSGKLYIEDRGFKVSEKDIIRAPRVGVDYAGPIWSRKKYNFRLKARSKK